MPCDFSLEKELWEKGFYNIAGIDEAGRGPLAGPVCVACVILPHDFTLNEVNDSKKLSEKKRELLYDYIIENAVAYNIVLVDNEKIDELNILNATFYGMCQSAENMKITPDFVLIDGNRIKGMTLPHECIVKGDSKSVSIAAASILAKVTRDRFMLKLDEEYPQYQFSKHKGYPTKLHYEMLEKYGPCPYHRRSFRLNAK